MSQLPNDVSRCVSSVCGKRDLCARFMDSPTGSDQTPYTDLYPYIMGGSCFYFIQFKPHGRP